MMTTLPSSRIFRPASRRLATARSRLLRSMEMCPATRQARPKTGIFSSSFFATKWKSTGRSTAMAKMSNQETWLAARMKGVPGSTRSSPCATAREPLAQSAMRAHCRVQRTKIRPRTPKSPATIADPP